MLISLTLPHSHYRVFGVYFNPRVSEYTVCHKYTIRVNANLLCQRLEITVLLITCCGIA